MVDRTGRRAGVAHRVETAVHAALTQALWGPDTEETPYDRGERSILADFVEAALHRDSRPEQRRHLERAGVLPRQAAQTGTAGIQGVMGASVSTLPAWVQAQVARRAAGAERMIDALSEPLAAGPRPWVASLPPPVPAGIKPEHATGSTRAVEVSGAPETPTMVAMSTDLPLSIYRSVGDQVLSVLGVDVAIGVAKAIEAALVAAAPAPVASLSTALGELEAAGWVPTTVLMTHSTMADFPNPQSLEGLDVVAGAPVDNTLVVSLAGLDCRVSEDVQAQAVEPHIGGMEVAAFRAFICEASTGAVRVVS